MIKFTPTNKYFTMKRIFAIFISSICLSLCHEANAQTETYTQDAVYLVPNPRTARWSYVETDSNGQERATIYYSVDSIEGDAVNGNIKLRVEEVPVASPKDTTKSFDFYRFKNGELMADVYAGFEYNVFDGKLESLVSKTTQEKYPDLPEGQKKVVIEEVRSELFKISGEIRGIPRYPKVGKLSDYDYHFKFSIMSIRVTGQERRIAGKEKIQTEAGLFDCYILEETRSTKVMIMKDVEKIKSWYAYGIGLVKEITYDKNGKLLSTMILNEVNW